MKYSLFLIFFLSTFYLIGQSKLTFNKKFVQSEDKWVVFPADSTGSYNFGFIYIDFEAGLTLDYQGSFTINEKGKFIVKKKEISGSLKYRLEPNNVLIAIIPDSKLPELNIKKIPDWLKFYKKNENTVERQYKWGYTYNGWGECAKALEYLNKAYKLDPKYKGLKVELAFSYNCLKEYDKAIGILMKSIEEGQPTAYTIKELIYAQAKRGNLKDAEKTFNIFDPKISDKTYRAENAYNILQGYYLNKDIFNFNRWLKEVNIRTSDKFKPYVEQMIHNLNGLNPKKN